MSILQKLGNRFFTQTSTISNKEVERGGYYITPVQSLALWGIISLTVGMGLAAIFFILDSGLGFVTGSGLLSWGWWLIIGLIFSAGIGWKEEKLTVPDNHVGIITFFGGRKPIYLMEGDYLWIGRRIFLDINRTPIANANNVTSGDGEEQGFVYIGSRTLQIWNSRQEKKAVMTLVTRGSSSIDISLTIKIWTIDPLKWASSDDAVLQVADQARAGLRKAVSFFRDTDIAGAKSAVVDLLYGKVLLTAFTNVRSGSHLVGTMVKNQGGVPLYLTTESGGTDGFYRSEIANIGNAIRLEGEGPLVAACKKDGGEIAITKLEIDEKLTVAVGQVGTVIENLIVTEVQLSGIVRQASEKAASEGAQREGQIMSADTQVEVMKKLAEARKDTQIDDLDRALAAAADGNEAVRILVMPGSSGSDRDIARAAAIIESTRPT